MAGKGFENKELARKAGMKSTRAGITDKVTAETRLRFQMLVDDLYPQVIEDLTALEPKERVKAFIELAKFVLPRLNAIDITTGGEQIARTVTIQYKENED
jgi:hypothetical protein